MLVGEETLHSMTADDEGPDDANGRRLVVTARSMGRGAELEFISATEGENLEDRLAYLGEGPEIADDREISYRLLRHLSSSVSHQKYHGVDVVAVSVANAQPRGDGDGVEGSWRQLQNSVSCCNRNAGTSNAGYLAPSIMAFGKLFVAILLLEAH